MENFIIEKSKSFSIDDILGYTNNSVVTKTISKKLTGSVSVVAFDTDATLIGRISPFDCFIQVIDGKADIVIEDHSNLLETGQFIIIPAHSRNMIKANGRFQNAIDHYQERI